LLSNNYERIGYALRLVQDGLRDGIFDAAKVFGEFNGEIIRMVNEFKDINTNTIKQ